MGKSKDDKGKAAKGKDAKGKDDELRPGTVAGELDFYDNVAKPISDALKAADDWLKGK